MKQAKRKLLLATGLVTAVGGCATWLIFQYPYVIENPVWLWHKPAAATVVESLPSARNIDYKPLRSHLQAKRWEKADQETARVIGKITAPTLDYLPFLRAADVRQLPCTDLYTIDRLWSTYSNGRFGFKAQQQVVEGDRHLPTPAEFQQQCFDNCQNAVNRSSRCVESCLAQRILLQVDRIPNALGRGTKAWKPGKTGTLPPPGYYPSIGVKLKSTFSNFHPYIYQEFADRSTKCGL